MPQLLKSIVLSVLVLAGGAAADAHYLDIDSNCGHIGSSCEAWQVNAVVNPFLD